MGADPWVVRLTAAADYRQILCWSLKHFGRVQARTFADALSAALKTLSTCAAIPCVTEPTGIATNIRTLHVARVRRKGRHFMAFREGNLKNYHVIDVPRLLHDSMGLERHVSPAAHPGRVPG